MPYKKIKSSLWGLDTPPSFPISLPGFGLLLICFYFSLSPELDIFPWLGQYNEKRLLEILLLFSLGSFTVAIPALRCLWLGIFNSLPRLSKFLLAILLIGGIASCTGAKFPRFAFIETGLFCLLFFTTLSIAGFRHQLGAAFDKMVTIALLVTGWFYLIGFSGFYFGTISGGIAFSQRELFTTFSNIRFFSQFQSWTLPLIAVPFLIFPRHPLLRAFFISVATGWWLFLFVSGTRGTLLACTVVFPLTLLLFGRQTWPWLRWQAITIAMGLSIYFVLFFLLPELTSLDTRSVLQNAIGRELTRSPARITLWSAAVNMILASPVLGIGPMQYAASTNLVAAHPHNSLMQIAAEWGVPAAMITLFLFFWGLSSWVRKNRKGFIHANLDNTSAIIPALFASLLTASIHSLVSGIIIMPMSQVMMTLIIGWMLGISIDPASNPAPSRLKQRLLCLSLAILFVGFSSMLLPDLPYLEKAQAEYMASHPKTGLPKPRLWQQGYLTSY